MSALNQYFKHVVCPALDEKELDGDTLAREEIDWDTPAEEELD